MTAYTKDDEGTEMLSDVYKLELLNIPLKRNSMDTKKNNNGKGEDRHVGKFTCKNSNVVDYCIGTSSLLGLVDDFCVLEFSSLFSDVHCPLSITLRSEHIIYSVD